MIFPSPVIIGAVVGAAVAYVSKDKKIKEWLSDKSSIGVFKKNTHYEEQMEESIEEVEDTEWVDKEKGDVLKNATEKLKKTTESIKEKTSEVIGVTTVKVKGTVERVKEKTPEAFENASVKVKEAIEWVKEKTPEVFDIASVKVKEAI